MSIPIDQTLIANAVPFSLQSNPITMNTLHPLRSKLQGIPFQITSTGGNVKFVNITLASTTPFAQLAAIYVDATLSDQDITIIFPDTGYEVKTNAGNGKLVPIFTGTNANAPFYVIFGLGALTNTYVNSKVNIILLDQFVPEFDFNDVIKANIQGPNANATGFVSFPARSFAESIVIAVTETNKFLGNTGKFLTGLEIKMACQTGGGTYVRQIYIFPSSAAGAPLGQPIFTFPALITPTLAVIDLIQAPLFNTLVRGFSQNTPIYTMVVSMDNHTDITKADAYINMQTTEEI